MLTQIGLLLSARNACHGIASRLSRAKIKCSICSSQFNTWDAQHRWALVLIVCLNRERRFKARFVALAGCLGIAVLPSSAHNPSLMGYLFFNLSSSFLSELRAQKEMESSSRSCFMRNRKFRADAERHDLLESENNSYLPDEGLHRDHVGGGPRARPGHCTSARLTPAIIPNVDNSVV